MQRAKLTRWMPLGPRMQAPAPAPDGAAATASCAFCVSLCCRSASNAAARAACKQGAPTVLARHRMPVGGGLPVNQAEIGRDASRGSLLLRSFKQHAASRLGSGMQTRPNQSRHPGLLPVLPLPTRLPRVPTCMSPASCSKSTPQASLTRSCMVARRKGASKSSSWPW